MRVIANLVSNAVRHTTRGGALTISASARAGDVAISVADTGSGIPVAYLPRIFDKFVQVPNAPSGGAGLGDDGPREQGVHHFHRLLTHLLD